jgi:hypothetical protein
MFTSCKRRAPTHLLVAVEALKALLHLLVEVLDLKVQVMPQLRPKPIKKKKLN